MTRVTRTIRQAILAIAVVACLGSTMELAPPPADGPRSAATRPLIPRPTERDVWSKPVDGFRLRLTANHPTVTAGEPVDLDVDLENDDLLGRYVLMPMVRPVILPPSQVQARDAIGGLGRYGDLILTADPVGTPTSRPAVVSNVAGRVRMGAFFIPAGSRVKLTITLRPPEPESTLARVNIVNRQPGVRQAMLHLSERTTFPGLTAPGLYRIHVAYQANAIGSSLSAHRVTDLYGDDPWSSRVEAPSVLLEVLPASP